MPINLHDESKRGKGDARTDPNLTNPGELMSIIEETRRYLDLLEAATQYGDFWVGYDEQKELAGMACELDGVCVNKGHLETLLERWENRAYIERRDYESQAGQIQTDGLATGRG